MEYVLICCRLFVGAVFAVSAVSKVRGRGAYAAFLDAAGALAPWVPPPARTVTGPVVVAGELAVAVLLVPPATVVAGFAVAAALLAAFTAAIASALLSRRRVPCACFGGGSRSPVGPAHLVRNGVLLAGSLTGSVLGLDASGAVPEPAGAVAAAFLGLVVAGLVLLTDGIAGLLRPSGA
ncbi:MauE/DoxX family redox-associated membrane protein [Microbispora catharanthi]|uniref:MauE/DoxX family redox-associated membrane protein n=1 Tax=Microbispora catharanthi TaxID=1712871 RepID=UPI001378F84E|nr:MauE/DoxX family redox-associated membrane protein [Microbispora catharanthi]